MSSTQYDETELRQAIMPLIDFAKQDDFTVVEEVEGTNVAMAFAVGMNCIEALSDENQGDWLIELIRKARLELSADDLKRLEEQGM